MGGPLDQKAARSSDPGKGRARALIYLVAAAGAALGVAVLLTRYMDTRIAAVRVPTQKVVVAASELAIATTLRADLLTTVDWPLASRPEGTVNDAKELEGRVVNAAITKGEPILQSKLTSGDTGRSALSTVLAAGMRAMSVHVDDVVGVAGFVHPGDHVDVIVTMSVDSNTPPTSKIILQNIKVLAVGKELESRKRDPQAPVSATVATLMVDSAQAEKLALAASKGQILLALRSSIDTEVVATTGIGPHGLLAGAAMYRPEPEKVEKVVEHKRTRAPKVVVVHAAPPPAPPPPRDSKTVEILRGDLFEKRDFQQKDSNR